MIDRSITDAEFARDFLGGKSVKTARRRIIADKILCQKDHGTWLIKVSAAEAWRAARMKVADVGKMNSRLDEIIARARAKGAA